MSLGNLAENIYNGNVSLDAAKQEQRVMENMLEIFMQGNFTKDEEKFSLLFKKICFHCLNHMCLVKMNGKKNILLMKTLCQKSLS